MNSLRVPYMDTKSHFDDGGGGGNNDDGGGGNNGGLALVDFPIGLRNTVVFVLKGGGAIRVDAVSRGGGGRSGGGGNMLVTGFA